MAEESRWGTVFMGPTSDRESRLDKIANRDEQETWNQRTEAEYLRRVRDRAVEHLNTMLAEAQQQAEGILDAGRQEADAIRDEARQCLDEADTARAQALAELAEAERIRLAAHDEGYSHGVEQALLELDEQRSRIDATTLSVLKAMEDQCDHLFESWRDELSALLCQSVETSSGWVLDEQRTAILEQLLEKSLEQLEKHRRIVVRANPDDAPAVEEVVDAARRRFSDLQSWDIQPDPTMAPGGLVVESVSGKVDSRAETRRDIVEQALRHLTLPRSEADDQAIDNVLHVAAEAGVPALEQAVNEAEQRAQALADQEQAARELEEQRLAQELLEQEQAAQEQAVREQLAQEQADQEQAEQEQADAPEDQEIFGNIIPREAFSQEQEYPPREYMAPEPAPVIFNALPAAAQSEVPAEDHSFATDEGQAHGSPPDMDDLMKPSLPPELADLLASSDDDFEDELANEEFAKNELAKDELAKDELGTPEQSAATLPPPEDQ